MNSLGSCTNAAAVEQTHQPGIVAVAKNNETPDIYVKMVAKEIKAKVKLTYPLVLTFERTSQLRDQPAVHNSFSFQLIEDVGEIRLLLKLKALKDVKGDCKLTLTIKDKKNIRFIPRAAIMLTANGEINLETHPWSRTFYISPEKTIHDSSDVDLGAKQIDQSDGYVKQIAGVNTYTTGQGKSAIVIFTDPFGYSFINTRKLADAFSQGTQTTVLIPDYFNEDPIGTTIDENLVADWLKKHPPTDACHIADKFLSTIKGHYDSIQIIGFSYGAKVVVHIITHEELSSTIKAAIVAYPSFLVKEEAKQIKRPILFLCVQHDELFARHLSEEFENELTGNGIGQFIEYPGTVHGFIVTPGGSENVIYHQQRDKAIKDAITFFNRNL